MENNRFGLNIKEAIFKIRNIFLYSDSEPNELLIGLVHMMALPATICFDFQHPFLLFVLGSIMVGGYQFYAVICGCLDKRYRAAKLALTVAVVTVINLIIEGMLNGSRVGWAIIALFAGWNLVRITKEKHYAEKHRND